MTLPQHSSNSEHYITPKFVSDAYREVLGENIALDPATSVYNNSLYIKATNIYTEADNGLEQSWKAANVFLNFPSSAKLNSEYRKKYGDVCCKVWFNKFVEEFNNNNFDNGLIVLFSNAHLNILDFELLTISQYSTFIGACSLYKRVRYEVLNKDNELTIKDKPTHHSSIVFVTQNPELFWKFSETFNKYGNIWKLY